MTETVKVDKWVKRWEVQGSNGHIWIVGQDREGNYGCSCPIWTKHFPRKECHHIEQVKNGFGKEIGGENKEKPKYVLAKVLKPTYKPETNELLIPLIAIPDSNMMEVTICFYMLKYGYSMGEIREIRRIPKSWTAQAIKEHIETHGEAKHPDTWLQPFGKVQA